MSLSVFSAVLALRRDCAGVSTRSGEVDQSGGSMLSDDVQEQGYVLVCASRPLSDCLVKTVPEVRARRYQVLRDASISRHESTSHVRRRSCSSSSLADDAFGGNSWMHRNTLPLLSIESSMSCYTSLDPLILIL
jgi:hypothetical protein